MDASGEEAAVESDLDHQVWIVTGKGKDFSYFPVPEKKKQKIELKGKGLSDLLFHNFHFMICCRDEENPGRWEGKSYNVKGLGKFFSLYFEKANSGEVRVIVEHEKHQEGKK